MQVTMSFDSTLPASHERITDSRFAAAYRVLDEAIAQRVFPGCAFGVLAAGRMVLQDARGRFTYEPDSPAVEPGTVFDLASVTKIVATTATAMLLYQRGRLDLDAPLGNLLPSFIAGRSADDRARRITLRHLLAHSSGLPGYVEFFRTITAGPALLKACFELQLEAEPGTRAEYSDPGFILLGKVLEAVLGESLSTWARREIFGPLGMGATGFVPAEEAREHIPPTEIDTWFRRKLIQGEVQDENAWILGGVSGHAGLFSNAGDLLRFSAAILESGRKADSWAHLFAAETVEMFARRQAPAGSSRAVGWDTPSGKASSGHGFSRHSIGHLGYSGCSLWIDLDAGVAVVLLTNRTWPDRRPATKEMIREVRPAFHDAVRTALESLGTFPPPRGAGL